MAIALEDLVDLNDVRVLKLGDRLGLRVKSPRRGIHRGTNHLQGDQASEAEVSGLVHLGHASPPYLFKEEEMSHWAGEFRFIVRTIR